jgi:WD40 repeat protein/class 3 adenylate cyclase
MVNQADPSWVRSTSDPEEDVGHPSVSRTFLIADVRGYSTFTRERGDEAAALLAKRFADLARDAVEARSGRVIELRGDEAFAVFDAAPQAVRAAVELQATYAEESLSDPAFQLPVGIGIDAGDAVPVEDGYRGVAVNMAARLCSSAAAGQVLVTRAVTDLAGLIDDIVFAERGRASFKGFEEPVEVIEALAVAQPGGGVAATMSQATSEGAADALPPELDPLTPLVDRESEMRWLRGTWRQTSRGRGRILFLSGPAQIGKSRLAAEIAAYVAAGGVAVRYAGPGGTGAALALAAIRAVVSARTPTLLVLDDVDVVGPSVAQALAESLPEIAALPVLVLCSVRDPFASPQLASLVEHVDERGDGHRALPPLDLDGVRGIVRLYAGNNLTEAPVESMARASQGLPGRVHEVASDWARSEASRRLAAAAEFLSTGRERHASDLEFANNAIALKLGSLYTVDGRDVTPAALCPYKGLAPFDADDAAYFFGRERLVGELAARTVQTGILGVVGASGSGKSSSIAAGLLPSLGVGLLPGSDRWTQASMRPGEHPMEELARALSVDASDPLERAVGALDEGGRLVLVVDQFEEVFTTCADEDERASFLSALSDAARSPDHLIVVLAIRADHYGHLASYPALAELLTANHVLVGSMTKEELKRSIELPARRAGLRMESALVDALVEEVADEPGGLPLLSTALVELWGMRESGWVRMEAYERTGGVRGAVSRLAEASYAQLSDAEQDAARRLFLRLVVIEDGEGVSRRRVSLDELDLGRDAAVEAVITRFTQDRLLTITGDTVEVAHEALLREWPRSVSWLEADAEDRSLRQHVTQAARQWQAGGRETSELFRGARLSAAMDWSAGHGPELNELEREFLGASRQASEQETERQRRANRRLRSLLVGVAVFLVVALIAGSVALVQRGSARRSADAAQRSATVALAQSLGAQAVSEPHLDLAMLLAREAVALDPSLETRSDLLTTLLRAPTVIRTFHGLRYRLNGMALSPDASLVALQDKYGHVVVEDTSTGAVVGKANGWELNGFSPDGFLVKVVTTSGRPSAVELVNPRTFSVARTIRVPPSIVRQEGKGGAWVFFDQSGKRMGVGLSSPSGSSQGSIVQFGYPSGRIVGPVIRTARGPGPNYVANGRRLVEFGTRTDVFDARSGRLLHSFPVSSDADSAAASLDGDTAVFGGSDGSVRFLDLHTGVVRTGIGAHTGGVGPVAFTPDGKTAFSGGVEDAKVFEWDVTTGRITQTLAGHATTVHDAIVSTDGSRLFTGSFDHTVLEWDLTGLNGFGATFQAAPQDPSIQDFNEAVSPDGSTLAVGGIDGRVHLWDIGTDRRLETFKAVPAIVTSLSYTSDGELLVSGEASDYASSYVRLWRLDPRPTLVRSMQPVMPFVAWATISGDGRFAAASGILSSSDPNHTGAVVEWDTRTGKPIAPPTRTAQGKFASSLSFGTSDDVVAAAGYVGAQVLDPGTRSVVDAIQPPTNFVSGVAYSPDGSTIASVDFNGFLRLTNATTGQLVRPAFAISQVGLNSVGWSPDGRTVVTSDWNGAVRLTDVTTGREIGPPFQVAEPDAPFKGQSYGFTQWWLTQFTPDGQNIAVSDDTGRAWIFPVSLGAWETQACQVANRNFTSAEWAQFLPDLPYQQVCPTDKTSSAGS